MRQTNVFLNRVFKILRNICIPGLTQTFVLAKKCAMKIKQKKQRKKDKKRQALHTW